MKERDLTFDKSFLGNSILQFTEKKIGLDENILMKLVERYDDMQERHCKVFAMRFDVHMPEGVATADNDLFRKFQAHFIKKEKRQGYDPAYVAVREISAAGLIHYHELLLVNGSETERIHRHIHNANEALNSTLGYPAGTRSGLINDCTHTRDGKPQKNGILIRRKLPCQENKAENDSFRHASYLAKDEQKDPLKHKHEVFSSRLPK